MATIHVPYVEEIGKRLQALIASGVPLADACADVEIDLRTFYRWRKRGFDLLAEQKADPTREFDAQEARLVQFCHAVTRAQVQSRVVAVSVIRSAMVGRTETSTTTRTRKRTKVATTRRTWWQTMENGERVQMSEVSEQPYVDEDTTIITTSRDILPDPNVAFEFLARRDHGNWSKRSVVEIEWREKALGQIQRGELPFEVLSDMFDDEYAAEMFRDAGVDVPEGYASAAPVDDDEPVMQVQGRLTGGSSKR